ncbi:MAG: RDD family protein, partial [Pseudomonadota bacterium]
TDRSQIVPPEGVPLYFEVSTVGARLGAQIIDILLGTVFAISLVGTLDLLIDAPFTLLVTIWALVFFFIRAPYYVLTELLWSGRTFGKKLLKLRVVSVDGRSLAPYAVVLRNLMKEAEIFVPGTMLLVVSELDPITTLILMVWVGILLAVPLTNRRRQRLGDLVAGTYVVQEPVALLMPDLAAAPAARFSFHPHQLDHYGAFELQTLEKVLHASERADMNIEARARQDGTLALIVERIRTRIDYADAVPPRDHKAFLRDFYAAQRMHLESRQLMGDRRADKHHRETPASAGNGG